MCSSALIVRLRRRWVTRRCASVDGETDENISVGVTPERWAAEAVTRKFPNDNKKDHAKNSGAPDAARQNAVP